MRGFGYFLVAGLSVASATLLSTQNETTASALQAIQNQASLDLPECAVCLHKHRLTFSKLWTDIATGALLRPSPPRIQLLTR